MCGRFVVAVPDLSGIGTRFFVKRGRIESWRPRYNVAPTQLAPVITNESERRIALFSFGLIPSWAKQRSVASKLINARSETVREKPSFRDAFVRRRCVVPVTGYYEWQKTPGSKRSTPTLVQRKDGEILPLAGVWESWVSPDGEVVESFAILTCDAQGFVRDIHDRMPVALRPDDVEAWLSPEARTKLGAPEADDVEPLEARIVSSLVNSPANDGPECIAPVSESAAATASQASAQLALALDVPRRR